jgi:hypothetical protein
MIQYAFDLPAANYTSSIPYAKEDMDLRIGTINADLELKLMNGCIPEQFFEEYASYLLLVQESATETNDFARANFALGAIEQCVRVEAARSEHPIRLRAKTILADVESSSDETPNISRATSMIEEAIKGGRLATAEDYLNRLENRDTSFAESSSVGNEPYLQTIERFIELYDELYNACLSKKEVSLSSWAYTALKLKPQWLGGKEWQNSHDKRAEAFLKAWPRFSTSNNGQPLEIESYLKQISQKNFGTVTFTKAIPGCAFYHVKTIATHRSEADYAHPISDLGTNLPQSLQLVHFAGNKKADQIYSTLRDNGIAGTAFVMMDGFFTIPERRMLAERFRKAGGQTVLVLDQILSLYLATQYDTERMRTFLACSLPYTNSQPFASDGSVVTDEMFIGRRTELQEICSPSGTSIVYGGRQLGKTALLKRAKSLEDRPANHRRAIEFSALDLSGNAFVEKFASELRNVGLIDKVSDMPTICSRISRKIKNRELEYLLVLVDEADAMLKYEIETGCKIVNELVNLRASTANKFKCVFAGLHNVMRASKVLKDNSPMTKLGVPLCIKPLSYPDARRLVRYPMSYLGVEIGEKQLMTILTESNNYPGNIHLICGELAKTVSARFYEKYRHDNPPFLINDGVLGGVIREGEIRNRIQQKLMLTLQPDKTEKHYYMLACAIAYLVDDSSEGITEFSIPEIGSIIYESGEHLSEQEICALLDEMCYMSILTCSRKISGLYYRFRRNSFRKYLGSPSDILDGLLGGNS